MLNITKPTLILDKEKCLSNIQRMLEKARKSHVHFRPHFKTHQSAYIGNWFRKLGIHAITVSSVSMAKYFAAYGWKDITIAFPVNLLEIGTISELSNEIKLNLLIDNLETLKTIENFLTNNVGIFVEIDTGNHRSGLSLHDLDQIDLIMDHFMKSDKVKFKGFLTHSGHTYLADSTEKIREIYVDMARQMNYLKDKYKEDWPELILSTGDTPSCSLVEDLSQIDEIRPGNFVFYDLMQYSLGACTTDEIALSLACPVVSKSPRRNEIVIYGGAIHLSKDFLMNNNNERIYGYVVKYQNNSWTEPFKGTNLINLTQEHGIIRVPGEIFSKIKIGDILGILPVHSCLTANLHRNYRTFEGENINY